MTRSVLLPCLVACCLVIGADVADAEGGGRPSTTRQTDFAPVGGASLTTQAMLESVPSEWSPHDGNDAERLAGATKWLNQHYAGQSVTMTGTGKVSVGESRGPDENVVGFSIHSFRPLRWASTFVTSAYAGECIVGDAAAKRMRKHDGDSVATVRLTLESATLCGDDERHVHLNVKGKMTGYTIR